MTIKELLHCGKHFRAFYYICGSRLIATFCGKLLHLCEGVTTFVGVMEYTLSHHNSNPTFAEIKCKNGKRP